MRYSRNYLSKQGDIALGSPNEEEVQSSNAIIDKWRTDHIKPLHDLRNEVSNLIDNEIKPYLISSRIKRMTSIIYKIDINPSMGLGGMNDIAGLRVVFNDLTDLNKMRNVFEQNIKNYKYIRTNDYIDEPKPSGYRSIHFIYHLRSDDPIYDNLKFELQIRTKLQHTWATALETVDIHTKGTLKSGYGSEDWKNFFKLVSALFSYKEGTKLLEEYRHLSVADVMKQYYIHNKEKQTLALIKAFKKTVEHGNKVSSKYNLSSYLLEINLDTRTLNVKAFLDNELDKASTLYYEKEKEISKRNDIAVVLVSADSYKELQKAYPSYFMDIEDFTSNLDKVIENCDEYFFN